MAILKTLIYMVWTLLAFTNCAALLQESDGQIEDRIAPNYFGPETSNHSSNFNNPIEITSPLGKLFENILEKLPELLEWIRNFFGINTSTTQRMFRIKRDTNGSIDMKKRAKKFISSSCRTFKLVIKKLEELNDKKIKTTVIPFFKTIVKLIDEDSNKIAKKMIKMSSSIIPMRDIQKTARIINGKDAEKGQFPWQVALFVYGSFHCGGALISEQWILTAAHCAARGLEVYLGTMKLHNPQTIRQVSKVIIHPEYSAWTLANDIALLKLRQSVTFSKQIQPISLAQSPLDAKESVTVSGWGRTSHNDNRFSNTLNNDHRFSNTLKYVKLATITNVQCSKIYRAQIKDGVVCCEAGKPVKSTCKGDSGGPLVTGSGSSAVHVGIVSFGHVAGCESGYPSAYTRTAFYRDWIKQETRV